MVVVAAIFLFYKKEKGNEVAVDTQPVELCYRSAVEGKSGLVDRSTLHVKISGTNVTGDYQNLPAEKDKKVGTFVGTVGPVNPQTSSRMAELMWNSSAEGMNVTEELNIEFGEGSAVALFGEMVDRGDGVYMYKDKKKLSPGVQLSQFDCGA